jgi:hypothetical protein
VAGSPHERRVRSSTSICKQQLSLFHSVQSCYTLFYLVPLSSVVVCEVLSPFLNSDVIENIALCCAHVPLLCGYNTCRQQKQHARFVSCVCSFVLPQQRLRASSVPNVHTRLRVCKHTHTHTHTHTRRQVHDLSIQRLSVRGNRRSSLQPAHAVGKEHYRRYHVEPLTRLAGGHGCEPRAGYAAGRSERKGGTLAYGAKRLESWQCHRHGRQA